MGYELISIDLFQTIVNVDPRIPFIWSRILGDRYEESFAKECAALVENIVIKGFHEGAANRNEFINLKDTFEPFFQEVLQEKGINFSAKEAVQIFMEEHTKAIPYGDVDVFFYKILNKLPICLVSDSDYEMVVPFIDQFDFHSVFISEKVQSYKNAPSGKIFKEVLAYYGVDSSKVLHIGDSSSDVLGAKRVGMKTCWINREDLQWKYQTEPDFIVYSLEEALGIINVG